MSTPLIDDKIEELQSQLKILCIKKNDKKTKVERERIRNAILHLMVSRETISYKERLEYSI